MNLQNIDIDRIVREVIALLQAEATTGGVSCSFGCNGRPVIDNPDGVRQEDTIRCNERVVTLSTLDGKLDGIRFFVARSGAVVTPSVKDLFRDRGITWSRDGDRTGR